MNQNDDKVGWWSYFLCSALLELPGAVVNAVVCGLAIWFVFTRVLPH